MRTTATTTTTTVRAIARTVSMSWRAGRKRGGGGAGTSAMAWVGVRARPCGSCRVLAHCRCVYVSMSRLRVAPERSDDLVSAFRARAGLVDAFDGFVDLQVWRSDRDPTEVLMVSRWASREHFRAYMRSAEHRVSHERVPPAVRAAIRLERLEHLHGYEVVAE